MNNEQRALLERRGLWYCARREHLGHYAALYDWLADEFRWPGLLAACGGKEERGD